METSLYWGRLRMDVNSVSTGTWTGRKEVTQKRDFALVNSFELTEYKCRFIGRHLGGSATEMKTPNRMLFVVSQAAIEIKMFLMQAMQVQIKTNRSVLQHSSGAVQ